MYIIRHYSNVKIKDIIKLAGKWMGQEIILIEVIQIQKDKRGKY